MLDHKCSSFSIDLDVKSLPIKELISVASRYVLQLRKNCDLCLIWNDSISAAEIANLLVLNKNNRWILAIDMSVYSKNQQFRCFDCVKQGKQNRLIQSEYMLTRSTEVKSFNNVLSCSLITYNVMSIVSNILHLENSQFVLHSTTMNFEPILLRDYSIFQEQIFSYSSDRMNPAHKVFTAYPKIDFTRHKINKMIENDNESISNCTPYHAFIDKIITRDPAHRGFIRSFSFGNTKSWFDLLQHRRKLSILHQERIAPHTKYYCNNCQYTTTCIFDSMQRSWMWQPYSHME